MKVNSILRGVAIHFVTTEIPPDLFITDLVHGIQQRYRFFEVPTKASELDPSSGVQFQLGKFRDTIITKLSIYENGFSAEAAADTATVDEFLDDIASWSASEFAVTNKAIDPVSRVYLSSLEVESDIDFSPQLDKLAAVRRTLHEMLTSDGFTIEPYDFNGFSLQVDHQPEPKPLRPSRFAFERRVGRPFSENIYYSEAPLSTQNHLRLLEKLEASF